jgi:hypothetical protein
METPQNQTFGFVSMPGGTGSNGSGQLAASFNKCHIIFATFVRVKVNDNTVTTRLYKRSRVEDQGYNDKEKHQ